MAKRYKKLMGMLVTAPPHRGSVILTAKPPQWFRRTVNQELQRLGLMTRDGRPSQKLKRATKAMMAETPKAVR